MLADTVERFGQSSQVPQVACRRIVSFGSRCATREVALMLADGRAS